MGFGMARRMELRRRRTGRERSRHTLIQVGWFALAATCLVAFRADKVVDSYHDGDLSFSATADAFAERGSARRLFSNATECSTKEKLCYVDDCEPEGADALVFPPHPIDALLLFYLFVMLYTFIGIAIVCDEMFVPALEVIAERWELSNDVAGATLMAAGGSAPELSTSLIGTFRGSDVGFAAIVGSAVFNVLFVIAMCALFTPKKFKPLTLTWWPLARDCSYYILSLCTLAAFFKGPWSPNKITLFEAILQFMLYIGYVVLMKYSERLEAWVKSRQHQHQQSHAVIQVAPMETEMQKDFFNPAPQPDPNADFKQPNLFRMGIIELLTRDCNLAQRFAVQCVSSIEGNASATFDALDYNHNGFIGPDELKKFLNASGDKTTQELVNDDSVREMVDEIDPENKGTVSKDKFIVWYMRSSDRVTQQVQMIFEKFDTNKSGTITRQSLKLILFELGHSVSDKDVDRIEAEVNLTAGEISLTDFNQWYSNSLFWTEKMEEGDEAANVMEKLLEDKEEEEVKGWAAIARGFSDLSDPNVSFISKFSFLVTLPFAASIAWIPDMGEEANGGWSYFVFIFSIAYIGVLCVFMVESATVVGYMLCIPDVVMGLVFLAAGTSVPDLISSVLVAQEGHGDMAVSSSIGSNIFDVCVGLPVPWLLFSFSFSCSVTVSAGNLFSSLCILLIMVAFVVLSIKHYGWKMTNELGGAMFVFYILYLIQDMTIVFVSGDVTQDNSEC